jgi:putative ABC transport system permease protein
MTTLWQDTKYGLRMLVKSPGFAVVAVLTLAIGISANITMFSVVNAVLLRPLPFENPDRLVVVQQHSKQHGWTTGFSYPDFLDWREQNQVFEDFAAYTPAQFDLIDTEGAGKIEGAIVSANFFSVPKTSASLGRTFTEADEREGSERVAVVSHDFWRSRLGEDRAILGRTITLQEVVYTIVGVLPRGFRYPEFLGAAQIWTVLSPTGNREHWMNRHNCWLHAAGRLKAGISPDQALPSLNALHERLTKAYGTAESEVLLYGLHDLVVRGARTTLWVLSGIVGLILLIVCANVANLCLARASARDKEMAIRGALGANKLRLLRQCLTESVLLSLAGGVTGGVMAVWMVAVFRVRIAGFVPMSEFIRIDPGELLFGLGVSLLVGVFLGVAPFSVMQRFRLGKILGERRSASRHHATLSHAIIGVQIAAAMVLSIGTVLMIRSIARLSSVDAGFNQENLATFNIGLRKMNEQQRYQFAQDLLERLSALPYVKGASTDSSMPCEPGGMSAPVTAQGHANPDGKPIRVYAHNVSADYFRTLQIPIRKGRAISPAEHQRKDGVVVVNEGLARLFWPDEDPIGKELTFCRRQYQVIGVVADMIQGNVKVDKPHHLFLPFDAVFPGVELKVVVRTGPDPVSAVSQVRAILRDIDPTLPLYGMSTFRTQMDRCISQERFTTTFLVVFALIALLLIVIGIYGVVSYGVAQRTREIGVRMALGARQTTIVVMVLRQGLILLAVGSALGVAGAIGLTRFLSSYLYEVSPTDPATYVIVPVMIAAVALLACYIPARRAAKIDPMVALRHE